MDTKDPTYEIPEEPTYHSEIRKFQNDDLLHADNVVNPVIQQIVENTAYNKGEIDECKTQMKTKLTKVEGKGLSTNDYTTAEKNKLAGLKNYDDTKVKNLISSKVTKVSGKGLSTNDYTTAEKNKLSGLSNYNDSSIRSLINDKASKYDLEQKQDKPSVDRNITIFGAGAGELGYSDTVVGYLALANSEDGSENNTAMGARTMISSVNGKNNTAMGAFALNLLTSGEKNVAVGARALVFGTSGQHLTNINNRIGLGYEARVSGDNQLQLGNSTHTVYSPGAIQNRSDARDKADIQDTELGLEFIKGLRPVQYRWDYRDDYFEEVEKEDGTTQLKKIPKDGSKKRKRLHQGFIAQEVKQLIDNQGVDFGGYQDHSINGGCDVLSLGYEEFIAPMVKAIQEQQFIIEQLQKQVKLLGAKK